MHSHPLSADTRTWRTPRLMCCSLAIQLYVVCCVFCFSLVVQAFRLIFGVRPYSGIRQRDLDAVLQALEPYQSAAFQGSTRL